jgi:hypothetical protein
MPRLCRLPILTGILVLIAACAGNTAVQPQAQVFRHDIGEGPKPWTHSSFDNAADKFTFALFSDLTGGEREGVFEDAADQLRLLRPELIINVGELIEGETRDRGQLTREWGWFDQRARRTHAPVFYVGGNHDLSNPVMWDVWEQRYGRRYYHFVYRDVLFLVLDTEDNPAEVQEHIANIHGQSMEIIRQKGWGVLAETEYGRLEERKTGRIGAGQGAYFRRVIAQYPEVRWTFVLMHKPAWDRPDEEHFATIEAALAGRPYTVFYGHVHAYLHQRRHGRDYIRLGTTGGVQLPHDTLAVDHVTLVTVSGTGVDIANIRMSGIFDKTGKIPLNGEDLCFEVAVCGAGGD